MPDIQKILFEMDQLLDQLIGNANELLSVSVHTVEEGELVRLQEVQEELLTRLIVLDDLFHKKRTNHISKQALALREGIDKKLEEFQQLNARFIQNITATKGLIHFKNKRQ